MENFRKNNGITLIALVITIVVLIILAGVTISMLSGNNGLLNKATEAKEQTEIGNEKEIISMSISVDLMNNKGENNTKAGIQEELDNMEGEGNTKVLTDGDGYIISFLNTNRNYKVEGNNQIEGPIEIEIVEDEYAGDITKNGTLDGSEEKPYKITCIEDLVSFSNMSTSNKFEGKKVILDRNLDFESEISYANNDTSFGDINGNGKVSELLVELTTGKGFEPIQNFYGIFDGNNNILYNLYIDRQDENVGLFSSCYGTIKNVGIEDIKIKSGKTVGGIVSYGENITIENCHVIGDFSKTTANSIGGIIGKTSGSFKNSTKKCYVKADMLNIATSGGIVGTGGGRTIIDECYHIGTIESNHQVGGIVGTGSSELCCVKNSYHIGDLKGSTVGGIVGFSVCNVFNCYSVGKITTSYCGGMIHGMNYGSHIVHCFGRRGDFGNLPDGDLTNDQIIKALSYYNNVEDNYGHGSKTQIGYKCNVMYEDEMKSINFVNELNTLIEAGIEGENEGVITETEQNVWKQDTNNINNGYPMFNWQ